MMITNITICSVICLNLIDFLQISSITGNIQICSERSLSPGLKSFKYKCRPTLISFTDPYRRYMTGKDETNSMPVQTLKHSNDDKMITLPKCHNCLPSIVTLA